MELKWMLLLSSIVVYITYCFVNRRNRPPGPLGIPILGYLPFLNPRTPYKSLHDLSHKYGPIFGFYLGSIYTVVISDVSIIRDALKREEYTGRAPLYLTHGIMGGYGIICAEGLLWKDQRRQSIEWLKKLGMSKFGMMRNRLEKRIKAGVEEFVQTLNQSPRNGKDGEGEEHAFLVNPMHALHHSMGNVINDLVFGITYQPDDATWKYLQQLQEEGVKHIGVSGVVNFMPILRFLPANRKTIAFLLDGKQRTHALYDRIIENARTLLLRPSQPRATITAKNSSNAGKSESEMSAATIKTYVKTGSSGDDVNSQNPSYNHNDDDNDCILKYFLREKEQREALGDDTARDIYTDIQLRHLLADLFGAGVDTSFTTFRWFLLYMANNPSWQAQLRMAIVEICTGGGGVDAVAGEGGDMTDDSSDAVVVRSPNLNDLEKLDLLKACISETQRIRSVVPLGIPHGTTQKTQLCNFEIPKNAMIIPLQWAVHMDPKVWPDPERFDPGRFLTDEGKYFVPTNFIPFQTGKRICPGEELARMMLYLYAGSVIFHYEFTLDPAESNINMEGDCGITLTPPQYKLHFKKFDHHR